MAQNSQQRTANLQRVQAFLRAIDLYPVNGSVSDRYGELKAKLYEQFAPKERSKRRRTKIQDLGFDDNDLWIAATAIHYSLTVVSVDSDFPRIQQALPLPLENWIDG